MNADDVTVDWLSTVLGGEIGSITTDRIGDGLVGMNLRVGLEAADPGLPDSVVIKLPSPDPVSRATGIGLRNYEREVKFYTEIAPTVDISVPRCFHGEWDAESGDFVLVLQDMHPAVQGDQIAACDIDDARASIAELARLHGPRWADTALDEVDWLQRRSGPEDAEQLRMLWSMFVAPFLGTYRPHLTSEAVDLVERFGDALVPWVEGREGPMTVTHGDYRLDNLLFDRSHSPVSVTAVDWQTPGHGQSSADVAYFCGAGLGVEERRSHERMLLDVYGEVLDGYGVDVDTGRLWHDYRRDAFAGVIMSVVASQVVGANERSEAMFTAMATRHCQHALDVGSFDLI